MTTVITYTHSPDEGYFNQYTGTAAYLEGAAEYAADHGWSEVEFVARRSGIYHMNRLRGPDWENTPVDRSRWALTVMGDKTCFLSGTDCDPTDVWWCYISYLVNVKGYTSDQLIAIEDIYADVVHTNEVYQLWRDGRDMENTLLGQIKTHQIIEAGLRRAS